MALTSSGKRRIDWTVRPARPDDKGDIESLFQASYGDLLRKDYEDDLLEIALPKLCGVQDELLTCSTWYVVEHPEEKQRIVGCGGWTPKSPFGEDVPHLRHFATDPEFTRQGIARALWTRTWHDWCDYFRKQNGDAPRPDMEVFSTLTAESFYASMGFQKVKDMSIPLGDDCEFPSILMRRPDGGDKDGT